MRKEPEEGDMVRLMVPPYVEGIVDYVTLEKDGSNGVVLKGTEWGLVVTYSRNVKVLKTAEQIEKETNEKLDRGVHAKKLTILREFV